MRLVPLHTKRCRCTRASYLLVLGALSITFHGKNGPEAGGKLGRIGFSDDQRRPLSRLIKPGNKRRKPLNRNCILHSLLHKGLPDPIASRTSPFDVPFQRNRIHPTIWGYVVEMFSVVYFCVRIQTASRKRHVPGGCRSFRATNNAAARLGPEHNTFSIRFNRRHRRFSKTTKKSQMFRLQKTSLGIELNWCISYSRSRKKSFFLVAITTINNI